jgi:hypothetical protein
MSNSSIQQFQSEQDFKNADVVCPEGRKNSCGVVYAVEFGDYVKVGCTTDIQHRIVALSNIARNYAMTSIGRIAITGFCSNWYECEAEAHATLADYRINDSEMFSVVFDVAVDALKQLHLNLVSPITPQEIEERKKSQELFVQKMNRIYGIDKHGVDHSFEVFTAFHVLLKKVFSASSAMVEMNALYGANLNINKALFAAGINAISWEALNLLNGNKDIESSVKTIYDEELFIEWLDKLANKEISDLLDN